MERAANTIRCTNCGRRHKRVLTDRPCYAARYCAMCKIRHSAKEGDIWAESTMLGLVVMYYACMDGAVYQITQWASCQKKNLKQLRPDCHVVQYRIVLGNKAAPHADTARTSTGHDPNLEEFLNNLYSKQGADHTPHSTHTAPAPDDKKRRQKKNKA
ncbi:cleavage inducing molecular chaperone domain-containing protein [Phthorimaea operculella]|nr:cleavage inducing molecular chaperone domain-containing protein [Phthorimaea operculella]